MQMVTGYVALLDVLGFSALVSGSRSSERLESYRTALDTVISKQPPYTVQSVVFSDSIVLTTLDDSPESLKALLRCCSHLFGEMLKSEIALRGAIAHGTYSRSFAANGVFVAGKAIIDAYE